jgi:hypothetical protein
MVSKLRFFFFLASNSVGEDAGRRGMREVYGELLARVHHEKLLQGSYIQSRDWVACHLGLMKAT